MDSSRDDIRNQLEVMQKKLDDLTQCINHMRYDQTKTHAGVRHHLHMIRAHMRSQESRGQSSTRGHKLVRFNCNANPVDENANIEDGLSSNESVHRECLQDNIHEITSTMDLKKTYVLDEMVQESCLSQDEAEEIRERYDRRDQNRKLVVTLSRRSSAKFVKFLEIMQRNANYPMLAEGLRKSYDEKISENRKKTSCLTCGIKRDVRLKDVVDFLFKHRMVDLEFVDLASADDTSPASNQSHLWESLFSSIDHSPNRIEALKILKESLAPKYEHIAAKVQLCDELSCHCGLSRDFLHVDFLARMSYPTSNASSRDISTGSDLSNWGESKLNRQTSTSHSVISSEDINTETLPQTLAWVQSTPETEDADTPLDWEASNSRKSLFQSRDTEQTTPPSDREDATADTPDNRSSMETDDYENETSPQCVDSLAAIGDSFLLEAAKEESLKTTMQPSGDHLAGGVLVEAETIHPSSDGKTETETKKKRRKHKSEPDQSRLNKKDIGLRLNTDICLQSGFPKEEKASTPPNSPSSSPVAPTRSIADLFYKDLKNIEPVQPMCKEALEGIASGTTKSTGKDRRSSQLGSQARKRCDTE